MSQESILVVDGFGFISCLLYHANINLPDGDPENAVLVLHSIVFRAMIN